MKQQRHINQIRRRKWYRNKIYGTSQSGRKKSSDWARSGVKEDLRKLSGEREVATKHHKWIVGGKDMILVGVAFSYIGAESFALCLGQGRLRPAKENGHRLKVLRTPYRQFGENHK